jgi:hypothetical protein
MTDPAELLSAEEAAVQLHQRPSTLASWRATKRGPRYFKLGRAVFYHPKDITAWVAAQVVEPSETVDAT